MKPKRKKKPKPVPVQVPNACVIVSSDPGETSGWTILSSGRPLSYGVCDVFGDGPALVIARAKAIAVSLGVPLVGVLERPFRVSLGSSGMGTAEAIWRRRLKEAGAGSRTVRVYPPTWRARILGRDPITGKAWATAKRDDVRAEEQRRATELLGRPAHPDVAPALLLGWWGAYSGEVAAKLVKKRKVKAVERDSSGHFPGCSSAGCEATQCKRRAEA